MQEMQENKDTRLDGADRPELHLWSERTQRRGFYILFALAIALVFLLSWPFVYALLFAATTATLAYPLYDRLRLRIGHRHVASGLVTAGLLVVVLLPVIGLAFGAVRGARAVARNLATDGGDPQPLLDRVLDLLDVPTTSLVAELFDNAQLLENSLTTLGPLASDMFFGLVNGGLVFMVYVVAVHYLLADGRRGLRAAISVVPIAPRHTARLFIVYRRITHSIVLGSLATAVLQALVAALGLWVFGVPYAGMLGFAIGMASFVPIVGTPAAWLPLVGVLVFSHGWTTALLVGGWNLLITGTVDNIAKPYLIGGREPIHPLWMFIAIFGGMYWMGLAGVLIGPLLMAICMTLYAIHREHYLDLDADNPNEVGQGLLVALLDDTGYDEPAA